MTMWKSLDRITSWLNLTQRPNFAKAIVIIVLAIVSGASFALGFFAGRATVSQPYTQAEPMPDETPPRSDDLADWPAFRHEPAVNGTSAEPAQPEPVQTSPERNQLKQSLPVQTQTKPESAANPKIYDANAASSPKPADGNIYVIQAGAYSSSKDAQVLASKLKQKGYDAYVIKSLNEGKTVNKVKVGRFKNKKDAQKTAASLKANEGISAFIASEK